MTTKARTVTIKSRPLTGGRVSWFLYFRPALPNGDTLMALKQFTRPEDRPAVEAFAKPYREALQGIASEAKPETCDQWYERFAKYREKEVGAAEDDKWRWAKWISPHVGPKPIRDITPDSIEDVRDALNTAVLAYEAAGNEKGEGRLAPKTALHVWSCLTTAMKYASTRKGPRELRVREDKGNPCLGIPPPRKGASKRRHWLRPDQFTKFIVCKRVPREWREAYAIGLFLHLRPGELHELRVKDLNLAHGEVRIARAYDERTKTVTTPKTDEGIRTVTVPGTLMPLLERIATAAKPDDRVCPIVAATPEKSRAGIYREHLQTADVDEPSFYVETATHLMIDFRSVRDSGITWRFLAGHRAEVVQRESGHEHISTTLGYAKEVQDRRGRYGTPFPPLPDDLAQAPDPGSCEPGVNGERRPAEEPMICGTSCGSEVGEAGFEPATTSTQSLCTTGLCDSPGNGEPLARISRWAMTTPSPQRRDLSSRPFAISRWVLKVGKVFAAQARMSGSLRSLDAFSNSSTSSL